MCISINNREFNLSYNFRGQQNKVGLCFGEFHQGDIVVGGYYAALYFDTKADLDVYIMLGSGTTGVTVHVRCAVGAIDKWYPAEPDESAWGEDAIKPSEYSNYTFAPAAFAMIENIVLAEPAIKEYLETGDAKVAKTDISQAGAYGLNDKDPWQYAAVLHALQFLALPAEKLNAYIPCKFPKTFFHGLGGKYYSTCPLRVHISIVLTEIQHGRYWNDWIGYYLLTDRNIEAIFDSLYLQVAKLDFNDDLLEDTYREQLLKNEASPWMDNLAIARDMAIDILKRIGWYKEGTEPIFSSEDILNKFSYGEYECNVLGASSTEI